ncbi:MAG TPA: SPOR domain-containing protein [Stellaceae bacterium]|nr:SPOR domain-containing protein [Stellaceae bacterium]
MALTPRQAATVFFGTTLFGTLTFASGLLIGVGIGSAPTLPEAPAKLAKAPLVLPGAKPVQNTAPAPQGAPTTGAVVLAMPPSTAQPGERTAAPATPAAPAATASVPPAAPAAAPPAAPEPVAVKEFRVGLPPEIGPVSPLRGRVVDAALAAPHSVVATRPGPVAATASTAQPAAPGTPPVAPPPAAAEAPAPLFQLSVQAGAFLVKANAERLAEALNKEGYAARVLMVAGDAGEPAWYPVVLAPVSDADTVTRLARAFAASEGRPAEVVSWLAAK